MKTIIRCYVAGFAIALLVAFWLISQVGSMAALNEVAKQDWTDLEARLQHRDDLISDLVSAVKVHAPNEGEVFTAGLNVRLQAVADAQGKLAAAATPVAKAEADAELTAVLGRLFARAGGLPELAADTRRSSAAWRKELADAERSITDAVKQYNEHVDLYNMCIDKIPGSFFAGLMGYLPREKFELPTAPAGEPATEAQSD
jgi:LemA protein